jgi:hypothetical protein
MGSDNFLPWHVQRSVHNIVMENNDLIEAGCTVKLKSNTGPLMTVCSIQDETVMCIYWDPKNGTFMYPKLLKSMIMKSTQSGNRKNAQAFTEKYEDYCQNGEFMTQKYSIG